MLSQRSLEAFQAVMRTGTVSAAAEELAVSQPAVSRLIRDLEERLELSLFRRYGGRVVATREAHELWTEVERSFVGLTQIERAAAQIKQGHRATLTIAAAPAIAQSALPGVVALLLAERPEFRAEFLSMTTLPVVRQVALRQCQIGFGIPSQHKFEIDVIRSGSVPFRFVAPADHPLGARQVIRLRDLSGLDFVGFVDSTMSGRTFDRLFAKMRHPPLPKMKSYLSHIVSALVLRGIGVGIIDAFTAEDHARMGGIVRPIEVIERFEYSIIKPLGDKLSGECDALVETFERYVERYQDA
ncbi:LysR family transcriptional regulator [Stappia taiwanensis]|uniref:LysR family transcriptional regulator n=1 Tax=Stappia taiwanensis TaxID=992267 RepID=A0A838XWW1_9HYPH|nr:LysR family transcriptional regulator [Stappia taiwanensis]MBA4613531.1 LysR family transcriptional regulator [Stappia taiwanensis]GGE96503.1 transcriptional regulator [Stappia taiwanensis]